MIADLTTLRSTTGQTPLPAVRWTYLARSKQEAEQIVAYLRELHD